MHYAFGFCIMWRTLSDYVLALVHYVLALDVHYVLALGVHYALSLWLHYVLAASGCIM